MSLKQQDIGTLDQIIYEHRHPNSDHKMPEEINWSRFTTCILQYHVKQCFKYDEECRYITYHNEGKDTKYRLKLKVLAGCREGEK
jgi:hypothetical protein